MKKCSDCNVEMIEDCKIDGQHPFEIGIDGKTNLSLHIPLNQQGSILGNKMLPHPIKARLCPVCGKIELYTNINK